MTSSILTHPLIAFCLLTFTIEPMQSSRKRLLKNNLSYTTHMDTSPSSSYRQTFEGHAEQLLRAGDEMLIEPMQSSRKRSTHMETSPSSSYRQTFEGRVAQSIRTDNDMLTATSSIMSRSISLPSMNDKASPDTSPIHSPRALGAPINTLATILIQKLRVEKAATQASNEANFNFVKAFNFTKAAEQHLQEQKTHTRRSSSHRINTPRNNEN